MKAINLRFSLMTLMGVIAAVAISCAALKSSSDFWVSAIFTLSIGGLLFSLLAALLLRDAARAIWIGFALFCGVYLLLVFGPWLDGNVGNRLLTSRMVAYAHRQFASSQANSLGNGVVMADFDMDGNLDLYVTNQDQQNSLFRNIGSGRFEDVTSRLIGSPAVAIGSEANLYQLSASASASGPIWQNFHRIAHSLLAILSGSLGAMLAMLLLRYRTSKAARSETEHSCAIARQDGMA